MFVCTVKASSIKFFAVLFLSAAALVALIAVIPNTKTVSDVANVDISYSDIKTNSDRVNFIRSLGYEVNSEHLDTEKVFIPSEFDSALNTYNDIQKSQGLSLDNLKGKSVTRYSYYAENYGYDGKVMITLLIYDGDIVAGDVTGLGTVPFVKGLIKET